MNFQDYWQSGEYYLAGEGPFYTDYLVDVQKDYPGAGLKVTIDNLSTSQIAEIPRLYSHSSQLIELFDLKFKYYEIGSETEDRWQHQIDKKFAEIKRRYEHWFTLYETNNIDTLGKILTESYSESGTHNNTTSGSSSNTDKSTFQDTPIQELMANKHYATNITDDVGTSERSGTDDGEYTRQYQKNKNDKDKATLELVEDNIRIWNDLINRFVDEFMNCFMDEITKV